MAVVDLNLAGAQRVAAALPHAAFAVEADVADAASVGNAVEKVLQRTGQIDILVNNAGIAGPAAYIWEQTDADWQRNIAINLTGVFNFCRAVVPHMRSRSYGRIVNVASIAGKEGNPRMVPYSATKAGVIGLTKALGKELATEGICVNAISPAVIQTQMLDQLTRGAGCVHDGAHSDAAYGQAGGDCKRRSFPGQQRVLLCDGAVLRRQRRPATLTLAIPRDAYSWNRRQFLGSTAAALVSAPLSATASPAVCAPG